MNHLPLGIVRDFGGIKPAAHPTDKKLIVFTNGADYFVCATPIGHERFISQPVIRGATEDEIKHHRSLNAKKALVTPFLW